MVVSDTLQSADTKAEVAQGIGAQHLHDIEIQVRAVDQPNTATRVFGDRVNTNVRLDKDLLPDPAAGRRRVRQDCDGDLRNGAVPIVYRLVDEQADAADIKVEYSEDFGVSWMPCAEYPSPQSEGRYGLATAPASANGGGILHVYVWDSGANRFSRAGAVSVRITPADHLSGAVHPRRFSPTSPVGPPGCGTDLPAFRRRISGSRQLFRWLDCAGPRR